MTMDKNEIIRVAEMNIDDLRKSKMKKIFTCLGISAVIVGSVGIAKAAGMPYEMLNEFSTLAIAFNTGILGVTVEQVIRAYLAEKITKGKLEKYKNGEYSTDEEYYTFLKDAVEYAGHKMPDMIDRINQSKGVSM